MGVLSDQLHRQLSVFNLEVDLDPSFEGVLEVDKLLFVKRSCADQQDVAGIPNEDADPMRHLPQTRKTKTKNSNENKIV